MSSALRPNRGLPTSGQSGERRAVVVSSSWPGSTGPPGPVRLFRGRKTERKGGESEDKSAVPDRVARSSRAMTVGASAENRSPDCPAPDLDWSSSHLIITDKTGQPRPLTPSTGHRRDAEEAKRCRQS